MGKVYIPPSASVWPSDPLGTFIYKGAIFFTCFALVAAFLSILGD